MSRAQSSRTVNLFCPSLSKLVPFVVSEDRGLDLGGVARAFGIDPATVRLNGHFISRGVGFISSVTWKSLLSFFAKKGFSTGKSSRDAVVVDGKFLGSPFGCANWDTQTTEDSGIGTKRKPWSDETNQLKKIKAHHDHSAHLENKDVGTKRKFIAEDTDSPKKRRSEQSNSAVTSVGA